MNILKEKRLSKGDLAQHVATAIESNAPFQIPPYLSAALAAAVA